MSWDNFEDYKFFFWNDVSILDGKVLTKVALGIIPGADFYS